MDGIGYLLRNQIRPGGTADVYWGLFTLGLSLAVVLGYCVIAFKWFFQFKLSERAGARSALARLRTIVICCALLGLVFIAFNLARFRLMWWIYDVMLVIVAIYTWRFAVRMRGLGLMDERLAEMAELEQSVERYRDIAELLPHMVWTATAEGRVDYSNQRWTEYAGEHKTWLDAVHDDERAQVRESWEQSVRQRGAFDREVRLGGRGQFRSFVVRATPIFHGEAVKWLGACADIEDQRRLAAEQQLLARQKAFFLNALSHDLRAPLNNIALNAHLLKGDARDEEEVETVNTIVENAAAAGELLTTLLEYASAGHEFNAVETVSIPHMLDLVRRRFLPLVAKKGLYLRVVEGDELTCDTDRHKLDRILSNLVDNAVKYTQHGGIELSARDAGDKIALCISDTGSGVPPDSAARLFDEFYQVDNQERDRSKGFGLGLAICKSLARQLGGDVRLVRTGHGGSCFEITIRDERAGRRGRLGSQEGDRTNPATAGLCRA